MARKVGQEQQGGREKGRRGRRGIRAVNRDPLALSLSLAGHHGRCGQRQDVAFSPDMTMDHDVRSVVLTLTPNFKQEVKVQCSALPSPSELEVERC